MLTLEDMPTVLIVVMVISFIYGLFTAHHKPSGGSRAKKAEPLPQCTVVQQHPVRQHRSAKTLPSTKSVLNEPCHREPQVPVSVG